MEAAMLEAIALNWPFFLLIAIFVGFSLYMARAMGSGSGGSNYISLMEAQVALLQEQVETQKRMAEDVKRQTDALERLASASEARKS